MSRLIERMETSANLAAIREFYPDATTVVGGIHHLLVERGLTIDTVVRMTRTYGGTIHPGQIDEYRDRAGLIRRRSDIHRDHKNLCTCCGIRPRDGAMLCKRCHTSTSDDDPRGRVSIGYPVTGRAAWAK